MRDRDRASGCSAELILDEVIARNLRVSVVAEPALGHQRRIAVVFIQVPVELIGAALGDQRKLATAAGSCICRVACHASMKLFDRVNRRVTDDAALKAGAYATIVLGGVARRQVIDVKSVNCDIVLIDGATATEPSKVTPACKVNSAVGSRLCCTGRLLIDCTGILLPTVASVVSSVTSEPAAKHLPLRVRRSKASRSACAPTLQPGKYPSPQEWQNPWPRNWPHSPLPEGRLRSGTNRSHSWSA